MATNDLKLKVTLSADGKQLAGTLKAAQVDVRDFGVKVEQAGDAATNSFSKTREGVESISTQLQRAQNAALAFIGVSQGLSGISSVIKIADDYGTMAERIRMATTSAADYELVQERLQETAGGTYRAMAEAQELYIQTADALRSLGYNTEQQLDITDSLSYAFVTNATSADKAASATNAFSRSLQTGKVSALDWQSLLMATPTIVTDIANATGKTSEEIRRLGIQGKLGVGELTEGLRLARDENQRLSDNMATTVDDALTRLRGNFASYIGELNQSSQITYKLADGIAAVAENLDSVFTVALVAGTAAAGRYAVALGVNAVASAKSTLASRAAAIQELNTAKAHAVTTQRALAHATANRGLMGTHAAAAQAATAHEAAMKRLAVAQSAAVTGGRVLLAVMTGPLGLAVAAGVATYAFTQFNNQLKETERLTNEARAKVAAYKAEQNSIEGLQARLKAEEETLAAIQATAAAQEAGTSQAVQSLEKLRSLMDSGNFSGGSLAALAQNYEKLQASIESTTAKAEGSKQRIADLKEALAALTAAKLNSFGQTGEQANAIEKLTDALVDQYIKLALGERAYLDYQLAQQSATAGQREQALAAYDSIEALKAQEAAQANYASTLSKSASSSIKSLSDVEKQSQRVWSALAAGKISTTQAAAAIDGLAAAGAGLVNEQQQWIDQMIAAMDPARALQEEITTLQEAFEDGLFGDLSEDKFNDYIDSLKKKLAELNDVKIQDPAVQMGSAMQTAAGGVREVASTMQGMYEQGSRGYQNMAVLMQAANLATAIGIVMNQGWGDPYTAFARMAAMAAAVGALGYQVSMMGGGWSDDAAKQQEVQGTGTVLGDSAAKSESIAKAVDITAVATSQLVGINKDMLRALQTIQAGITGATVRIAQGAKNVDFGATYKPVNAFDMLSGLGQGVASLPGLKQLDQLSLGLFSGAFKLVGKLLGGSSKVTDQGIQIIGGSLGDLMEDVVVNAYQTTKSKKYKWSSAKTREDYQELGDDVSDQFALVFESLADSVYAGAVALGFSSDEVEKKINSFTIATQKISTKGLTAEQQQKEIEAVFSSIFDNLAGSVVTFLPKFQQAGEGLGETLARVATNVQVTEEAVFRLGFAAENINPEQFATLSVYLIDAAGGLEQFIGAMSGFVDKFAPESHKLELLTADMSRALSEVGLSVPATREEMWQLMQTMDATTAAGADQIATLLRVGDTADAYYKMLEQAGMRLQALLGADSDALTDYLQNLANWSNEELSRIEADYRERIALAEQQLRIGRELRQYVEQLRISELSPYDPGEKLQLATEQFAALLVKAEAGDMEAARLLQSSAQAYLQNADSYYGRSDPYLTIFEEVTRSLDRLGLDIMGGLDDNTIERLNQQMLQEQQRIRDYTQQELSWAVRQYDALTSIEQLLELLPGSLADQLQGIINKPAPVAAAPDRDGFLLAQIEQMYTHHLGRDADVEGAQYWVNLARDEGLDAVDWNIRNSEEYKKIHGSHKNGLRSVPFDGYIGELHKKERVLTEKEAAEYNSFDSGAIVSELAALRQEVAQLRAERARDAEKAEQQRNSQTDATETLVRVNRTPVKMT